MKKYIGTKIVKAEPGPAPKDMGHHKAGTPGMTVEYEDGYRSWSPQDVFDKAYRGGEDLTFGMAIEAMKGGLKAARKGWNGKGQWIWLCNETSNWKSSDGKTYKRRPYMYIKTTDNQVMPWTPSMSDALCEDWRIVK